MQKEYKLLIIVFSIIGFLIFATVITGLVVVMIKENEMYTPDLTFAEGEDKIMLVDYCDRTCGTNGGDGYKETVLYYTKDGKCEVHYYREYEDEEEKTHTYTVVDNSIIDDVYKALRSRHFASWNILYKNSPYVITGGAESLKFRDSNGEYIRVSSEHMPEDGMKQMTEIQMLMAGY